MKKRILALTLVFVMLFSVHPTVSAAADICFVGVNDAVPLNLKGGAGPYYSSGDLYIPYSSFGASPNGVGVSYLPDQNTLVLFNGDQTLIFDLEAGTYQDSRKKTYTVDLAYKGGILYLPADVASHFGLDVTYLMSREGYTIIRFTNGSQVYDDGMFVSQAENLIAHVAEEYRRQLQAQGVGVGGMDDMPTEPAGPVDVYLAFAGDAVSQETLELLKQNNMRSTFYVTREQIEEDPQLIRAIYANDHMIGLTVSADESSPADAMEFANEALERVIFCQTLLALLPAGWSVDGYFVQNEPAQNPTVEQILEKPDDVHWLLLQENPQDMIHQISKEEIAVVQILETTVLS